MNTIVRITILTVFIFTSYSSWSQSADSISIPYKYQYHRFRKTELVLGMNWQANWREDNSQTRRYIELGVARSIHTTGRHGGASYGIYASEEMYFGSSKNIYGTKLGVYTHYILLDLGFSMVYYTDFEKGNFKLRPEIGVGGGPFRAVFGFNINTINNKAFKELSDHRAQVTVQFFLPVKKKLIK